MKLVIATLLAGSAAAFAPSSVSRSSTAMNAFTIDTIPGALAPVGCKSAFVIFYRVNVWLNIKSRRVDCFI